MASEEAKKLLATCEHGLRALLSKAATEGNYSSVQQLTELARAVSELAACPSQSDPVSSASEQQAANVFRKPQKRSQSLKDAYPKFMRKGDELVKVGWSKKDKCEYHHRAPKKAVDAVAVAVRRVGANGKVFTGDALLPLTENSDGSRFPDYQAYVALAWLKSLKIVTQVGRRAGYALVSGTIPETMIRSSWAQLPEWRG